MINKMPMGDIWELTDKDSDSYYFNKTFILDFSDIHASEVRILLKKYIWHNYTTNTLCLDTLAKKVMEFKRFNKFIELNNIKSLRQFTNKDVDLFISYINTCIKTNGKPLSQGTKRHEISRLKSLIYWGQIYNPELVPSRDIFTGNEVLQSKKIKVEYIEDEILKEINKCLINEDNFYIKCGLIILQTTGIRISELLRLKVDCLTPHLISGYNLKMFDYKNRKERTPIVVNNECVQAINLLIDYTKELRKEATDDRVKEFLFIFKPTTHKNAWDVEEISQDRFRVWIHQFIEKHDIKDSNGELYNLTVRQFRRTLATDMFSKGVDINVIKEVLGHSRTEITKRYYSDVKDKERGEIFKNIGIIGNIDVVDKKYVKDEKELEWFKENKDKGARMCDGYCTKPFKNGEFCDRLLKRKKCYTCSRYITTPEYLQFHKSYLAELEQQVKNNIYGDHYAEHFKPTINVLKEIIAKLEDFRKW